MPRLLLIFIVAILLYGCSSSRKSAATAGETKVRDIRSTVSLKKKVPPRQINTRDVTASEVVNFSRTLIGVKYLYGSADVKKGFDCSGFIYYVFNHFGIAVPRTSADFTNAGTEVPVSKSLPGDLILFTGSNAKSGVVGHMGIITENRNGYIRFIHASESRGVMISGMNSYFVPRFVKVNRIFTFF